MLPSAAYAVIDNPVTLAVIGVYNRELASNPKNYTTWFKRANEYYRHFEYPKALEDVNNALMYAPTSDTDLRFQAYMLRAGIYNQTGEKQLALADINSALALDPESYAAVYQKANTEFELGNYGQARLDYTKLQRFNSRSLEALLGLARCSVKDNDLSAANDYLQQAVEFYPNNAEAYVRRSSVREMMGDDNGAIEDLLLALSLDATDSKAIQHLVEYGNTNYAATIAGLTQAMNLAPDNGLYRYLRAMIAEAHFNYLSAINDFQFLIDNHLYDYHGLYASIARCLYGLARYDEALENVDTALGQVRDVADYFVLRSQILRSLGRNDDAIMASAQALAVDPNYAPGLVEMAVNYVDKKDYRQASGLLGEAAMTGNADPSVNIFRGWLHDKYLHEPAAAKKFYGQALNVEGYPEDNVKSLKGFALLGLDRADEGDAWMETILTTVPDNDGLANYYGACYYGLRGNKDKALACTKTALEKGYSDKHNWLDNNDGQINVASLRNDPQFTALLKEYKIID